MKKNKEKTNWLGTVLGGVAMLIFLLIMFFSTRSPASGIQLAPRSANDEGIAVDTAFTLTGVESAGVEELRANLTFTPQPRLPYNIAENGPGQFTLTPQAPLPPGGSLLVTVYGQEFAFTVQNRFVVTSTLPSDGRTNVPVNTGIEFNFSVRDVAPASFKEAFSIQPQVEGRFTNTNGRHIFYPTSPLQHATTYTVTLGGQVTGGQGATLAAPYSFIFTTEEDPQIAAHANPASFQIGGNGISVNSLASETPVFQAYIEPELARQAVLQQGGTVGVKAYAFNDWESYATQLSANLQQQSRDAVMVDTTGLALAAEYDIAPVHVEGDSGMAQGYWILPLPATLPEGWYALDLDLSVGTATLTRNIFLQVSDLSVFYMWSEQNLLAWVNDAATGQPVSGAQLTLSGGYNAEAVTGADGTARLANAQIQTRDDNHGYSGNLVTVQAGGKTFIDINNYYYYNNEWDNPAARRYMSYLFTDRPTYHTQDTMFLWGVARPRDPAATPAPTTATLRFTGDGTTQTVEVLPDGTFTAQFRFSSLGAERWCEVELLIGDDVIAQEYVVIEDFVKPIYTATARQAQQVYLLRGQSTTVPVELEVSTFDGSPVAAMPLALASYNQGITIPNPTVTTDGSGRAEAELVLSAEANSWYPQTVQYSYRSSDPQSEGLYAHSTFYTIHRDLMLLAKAEDNGSGGHNVRVSTNMVDISGVTATAQLWDSDVLRGAAVEKDVTALVYRVWYARTPTGVRYDYVNRTSYETYSYERMEELVDTRTFRTAGGEYLLTGLPSGDGEEYYYLRLESGDSEGRPVATTMYLGLAYQYANRYSNAARVYELRKADPNDGFTPTAEYGQANYYWRWYGSEFYDGENTSFRLMMNDEPVNEAGGRVLYCVVQDDFSGVGTAAGGAGLTVPFAEKLLPNYVLTGAYFDGKHVFPLQDTYMSFNPMHRELDIRLETDQPEYRPADDVNVTATVTNKVTGQPAEGATLVLAVVDEAVFALREQYINILSSMYQSIYYPNIKKYTSYHQAAMEGAGEMGNGGEDFLRADFEDTAYFATATTDGAGRASWAFTLPDNITSWRLTSLGINGQGHAGSAKINAAASREFFLLPVVNEAILTGDSFTVGLRGSGRGVAEGDTVEYTVRVQGNGVNETRQVSAPLRQYATVDFGASLAEGTYTVVVEGTCQGYRDGVLLPFTVKTTGLEVKMVQTVDLAGGLDIEPLRYPVTLMLYGEGAKAYNTVLRSVQSSAQGARADMRLARRALADLMAENGQSWYSQVATQEDLADINGSQLLRLLPYGQQDFTLSLRAHLAAPGLVSLRFMEDMTAERLTYTNGSYAAYLFGCALAGQPPEDDPAALLEQAGGELPYADRIWLAMAIAQNGDTDTARQWYKSLVTPFLVKHTGLSGAQALSIDLQGIPGGDLMANTAAASMLATMLATPEAEGLALFLAEKNTRYEVYLLEQLYYLRNTRPRNNISGTFSYTLGGETVTDVVGMGMKPLSLNQQQLAGASFQVLAGTVYADVYYIAAPEAAALPGAQRITFTKRVEPAGPGGFAVGELVKITLTPSFSGLDARIGPTALVVNDYIPSGMRYEKYYREDYYDYSRHWALASRQGQRLEFSAYLNNYGSLGGPIVYYARVTTPGQYVVESAFITSAYGELWGATERTEVTLG